MKEENPNKIFRGFKVRLYPTKEQEDMFYDHINCCRFVWNYMLDLQQKNYKNKKPFIQSFSMIKHITNMKQKEEYSWLNNVAVNSLYIICIDLVKAYKRFFEKVSKLPKFKSKKKAKKAYPIRKSHVYFKDDMVKIEKVGMVKYKSKNRLLSIIDEKKIINPRISLINGKWILSFSMECEKQTPETPLVGNMGIDMGIKRLATFSYLDDVDFIYNINKSAHVKRLRHKRKYLQRKINRLYKLHGNYEKTKNILRMEKQIHEIDYHLSNVVKDYNHKMTRKLVNMYPYKVIMENIDIQKLMTKSWKILKKEIKNASWFDFRQKMQYKCEELGIEFILADRYFPSSQICFCCKNVKSNGNRLTLKDNVFKCKKCGYEEDRDINAAKNLEWYGI